LEDLATAKQIHLNSDKKRFFRALDEIGNDRFQRGRDRLKKLIAADSQLNGIASLVIADSYFREGGAKNLQQAEISYREWLESFPGDKLAPRVMVKMS